MPAIFYPWKPIEPLSDQDRQIDVSYLNSLKAAWLEMKPRLQKTAPNQLKAFDEQTIRSWSIETGIIEHLYDLDEGATNTLVEQGFIADLIDRSSTNIDRDELISILSDQRSAADFVAKAVADGRELSNHLIRELHQLLTTHQLTVGAVDTLGNRRQVPLLRGEYKTLTNNPTRMDGAVHEYCPPVQVDAEMDRLLEMYVGYRDEHPIIVAAWLHHRFAQIHPFQDGNGRVSRCLVTLELLRGGYLPIVITRKVRSDYIKVLEEADAGNLGPLVNMIAELERKCLLQALTIPPSDRVEGKLVITDVVTRIADKLNQRTEQELRQKEHTDQLRSVSVIAGRLREEAKIAVDEILTHAVAALNSQSEMQFKLIPPRKQDEGGPRRDPYAPYQNIIHAAHKLDYEVSMEEDHYWLRRVIQGPRSLGFVILFHSIGYRPTGVMGAAGFIEISNDNEVERWSDKDKETTACMSRSFTFTWEDRLEDLVENFNGWLNETIALALQHWGDTL